MRTLKIAVLSAAITMCSCASRYASIQPEKLAFNSQAKEREVTMQYQYDVLSKKYAKKEQRKGLKLVALKILNNSEDDFTFGKDLRLVYDDGAMVTFTSQDQTYDQLKQLPGTHFLFLLLSPLEFSITTTTNDYYGYQENKSSFPIGLIIGPGITLLNFFKARGANKKFQSDLELYNIHNKTVPSGETVYGLVSIKSHDYKGLKIEVDTAED